MTILEREKDNRPDNEDEIRGIKMSVIERIKNLDHIRFFEYARYEYKIGYTDDIPMDKIVHFSDITEVRSLPDNISDLYLMHDYTSMSDYGGSLVEKANADILIEEYGFITVIGGYSSFACMIQVQSILDMPEDERDNLLDTLEGLSDYPLIDDQTLSDLESENTDEAWNDWAKEDFLKALCKKFRIDYVDIEEYEFMNIYDLFNDSMNKANEYWINESGYDMWIDVEKVVDVVSFEEFKQYVRIDDD